MKKFKRVLNLTQHVATQPQIDEGVIEPRTEVKEFIKELLSFDDIPSQKELEDRSHDLSLLAAMYDLYECDDTDLELYPDAVMLGGAPFFMGVLERWCMSQGLVVLYAFSQRESVDEVMPDGSVVKKAIFTHKGFVQVPNF